MKKAILIDAIIGRGFPTFELALQMEKEGFAEATGNQWNPDFSWIRKSLEALDVVSLVSLYDGTYKPTHSRVNLKPYPMTLVLNQRRKQGHRKGGVSEWWSDQMDETFFRILMKQAKEDGRK